MCTVLIADDELITIKKLFNDIIRRNKDIKLIGITNNGKEVLNHMENELPDVLMLDLKMPEMSGIEVLDKLILEKEKYLVKTKIIIISSYLEELYDSSKYRNYIYATLPKPHNINKLMSLLEAINEEIRNDDISKYVKNELSIFNFNKETEAYKYLIETIYEVIYRKVDDFDLENDIYYKIARINKKRTLQIKWAVEKSINTMFINTNYDVIQRYFNFTEYKKPTTKFFIKHIVENYNKSK